MNSLLRYQDNLLKAVNNSFRRYLHPNINWNQRMIGIKSPRGAGKTTLMLQHLKFNLKDMHSKALYVTADHTWFYTHTLLDTAMDWFKNGGRILFIDEVHKYPGWSRELKNIYDGLPEMKVIFSASSAFRETFLLNQLINSGQDVFTPVNGDFLINGLTIEVEGKSKTSKQVKDAETFIVASDDIETGFGTKVPLWLFGFLY